MSPQPVFLLRLQPDARLVRLARRGHAEAFEAIVLRYRGPLLAFCRRMLQGDAGQDAAQETFIRAWQALEQGTEVRELRPWLFTIARRVALRELAARNTWPEELDDQGSTDNCPAAEFERRAALGQLLSAMAALPEDQRDALVWTEMEGRSRSEIATQLGVTEGAVRQLVYRARGTLRTAAMALTPGPLLTRMLGRVGRAPMIEQLMVGGSNHLPAAATGTVAAVVVAAGLGSGLVSAPKGEAELARKPQPAPVVRTAEEPRQRSHSRHRAVRKQQAPRKRRAERRRRGPIARVRPPRRRPAAPLTREPAPAPPRSQPVSTTPAPAPPEGAKSPGPDVEQEPVEPAPAPVPVQPVDPAPPPGNDIPPEPPPDPGGDYTPDLGPDPNAP